MIGRKEELKALDWDMSRPESQLVVVYGRRRIGKTYLIRESIIGEQIDAISEGIVMRSLLMSAITACVLAALFIMMIIQLRKTSELAVERETSELMQQELEERITHHARNWFRPSSISGTTRLSRGRRRTSS